MPPRSIAIVRLSAIGDLVHGLPLARSLRRLWPDAEITWIAQPEPAPLLAGHPWVDRTMIFPRRGSARELLSFLREVGDRGFDLAVDVQGNMKSALVTAATLAPRRVGLAFGDRREVSGGVVSNLRATRATGPHSVDRTLALCRALGDKSPVAEFGLRPTAAERTAAAAALESIPRPTVAISIGGAADVREWPDVHYLDALRRLGAAGLGTVVLAGPNHADRARSIAAAAGVPHRAGETDLRGLLADLDALAGRGGALLACDSAPVHLAVAVGLPVVCLSGPQDPRRTGPYGAPEAAVTAWQDLPCAPCGKRTCGLARDPGACMKRIEPAEVVRRALSLVRG